LSRYTPGISLGKLSYNDLIEDFLNNYNIKESNLFQIVDKFSDNIIELNNNIETIRRNFVGSMTILFDIFEKSFSFLKNDNDKQTRFIDFRDRFIKFRYLLYQNFMLKLCVERIWNRVKKRR
jgi:hypothetical protein